MTPYRDQPQVIKKKGKWFKVQDLVMGSSLFGSGLAQVLWCLLVEYNKVRLQFGVSMVLVSIAGVFFARHLRVQKEAGR